MYKLSSIREDYLLSDSYQDINIHRNQSGLPLQYFEMSLPMMIHSVSAHWDGQEHSYTSLCLAPDFYTYYALTAEEAASVGNDGSPHQHNFYELIYVLKGELYVTIEGEKCVFLPGCGCLINKNVEHSETGYGEHTQVFYLQLSSDYAEDLLIPHGAFLFKSERHSYYNPVSAYILDSFHSKNNLQKDYLDLTVRTDAAFVLRQCQQHCENIVHILLYGGFGGTYALMGEILQLISLIGNPEYYRINRIDLVHNTDSVLFSRITVLMEESDGRISRSELERRLSYNGVHLNNIVRKFTGMTIFEYGMTFCMQKAKNLLLNTDKSVSEIAELLRFSNRTHFYRLFREKYQMTPSEFRKAHYERQM